MTRTRFLLLLLAACAIGAPLILLLSGGRDRDLIHGSVVPSTPAAPSTYTHRANSFLTSMTHPKSKTLKIDGGGSEETSKPRGYEQIHQLLQSPDRAHCSNTYVMKGEYEKEPNVHVCLDHLPSDNCIVYSFGIGYNWIFDDFMVQQGCQVFSFDPSMKGVTKHKRHQLHLFQPIGIGTVNGAHQGNSTLVLNNTLLLGESQYEVETLDHIMQRHGHTHVTVIRMDTEAAEWDVLEQWISEGWVEKFDQLLLEIHMFKRGDEYRHGKILHDLPMELFHVAKNRNDDVPLHGDMTRVYEVGWLKKDHEGTSTKFVCDLHPKTLQTRERKVFSQFGEDGVIEAIFQCILTTNKYYVEFVTESGVECNTRNLRENYGWHGLLMDGSNENMIMNLHREFITPDNIVQLLNKYEVPTEPDLISIDIDTTDLWVMQSMLGSFRPRVLITEFNSNFDRDDILTFPRDSKQLWKGTFYGASLAALQWEANRFNYHLLYTTSESVNAFWVRSDVYSETNRFEDVWRGVVHWNGPDVDHSKFVDPRQAPPEANGSKTSTSFPEIIPWMGDQPYPSNDPNQTCRWTTFHAGGKSAPMCVHSQQDIVSNSILAHGRWDDCDILTTLWPGNGTNRIYVDVGSNIGACVMNMLLTTDARELVVFEPNPANLFCLTSTLLRQADRSRVTVWPVALGEQRAKSVIYGATNNLGNSVLGKSVPDDVSQQFHAPIPVVVERYDHLMSNRDVALMKMDAQGFECSIVRGMGAEIGLVDIIKTEVASTWLSAQDGCSDLILFDLFHKQHRHVTTNDGVMMPTPGPAGIYDVVVRRNT